MRIIWTPEAERDRFAIWEYIAVHDLRAANRMDQLFGDRVARLADHPKLGRPGKIEGTRELIPHESYRIVYDIAAEAVWILAIVHTAKLWPPA